MPIEIDGENYYWVLEVCREARISRSTLLRWLERGVIHEPIKDRRGWRIFSEEDLKGIRLEVKRTSAGD
jgi:DNA-binding transcriptional MerR regulator